VIPEIIPHNRKFPAGSRKAGKNRLQRLFLVDKSLESAFSRQRRDPAVVKSEGGEKSL